MKLSIVALLLLVPWSMYGQDATTPPKAENPSAKEPAPNRVYGREVFVPDTQARTEPEPGARSFSDGFLRNTRQHIGFSLGVSETYTPDVLAPAQSSVASEKKGLSLTSIVPQFYINFQKEKRKKRFDFRLTYGPAYNRYNGGFSELNRLSQNGSSSISFTSVRSKTTLQISNNSMSMYYDPGSLIGASLGVAYQSAAPQVYLDSRRLSRSFSSAGLSYNLTKKGYISVSLDDDIANYGADVPRTNLLSAGVGGGYQIKKWLSFETHYSHYLNNFPSNNIENLQIAGLSFKPRHGWVIAGSGGIQSTKAGGIRWVTGSAQASVSKTSRRTSLVLGYSRGYSTIFPTADIWSGDTANVYVVQSLSRQISLHASASYIRGSALASSANLNTVYGSAGLDVALQKNLVFSSNYSLVSQHLSNISLSGTNLHRYIVTLGLNYYLPSVRTERSR